MNNMLPTLKNFFSSLIKVYPRKSKIFPQDDICQFNLRLNSESLQNGYSNTDLLIFLLGESNSKENYIAWATFCELDSDNLNRPLVGK